MQCGNGLGSEIAGSHMMKGGMGTANTQSFICSPGAGLCCISDKFTQASSRRLLCTFSWKIFFINIYLEMGYTTLSQFFFVKFLYVVCFSKMLLLSNKLFFKVNIRHNQSNRNYLV